MMDSGHRLAIPTTRAPNGMKLEKYHIGLIVLLVEFVQLLYGSNCEKKIHEFNLMNDDAQVMKPAASGETPNNAVNIDEGSQE